MVIKMYSYSTFSSFWTIINPLLLSLRLGFLSKNKNKTGFCLEEVLHGPQIAYLSLIKGEEQVWCAGEDAPWPINQIISSRHWVRVRLKHLGCLDKLGASILNPVGRNMELSHWQNQAEEYHMQNAKNGCKFTFFFPTWKIAKTNL